MPSAVKTSRRSRPVNATPRRRRGKQVPPRVRALISRARQEAHPDHLIVVDGVRKVWDADAHQPRGVQDISFTITPGEFVFITGASGGGKTTLLRMLHGDLRPQDGEIRFGAHAIAELKLDELHRRVSLSTQSLDAIDHLTVAENLAFPLQCLGAKHGWTRKAIDRRVTELLGVFGLEHARSRRCDDGLSAGERQRLSIARAIAPKPDLLLCDEPTGNVDRATTMAVMRTLNRVAMLGTTVVCVTHDDQVVNLMRKRVITIRDGQVVSDQQLGAYRL